MQNKCKILEQIRYICSLKASILYLKPNNFTYNLLCLTKYMVIYN